MKLVDRLVLLARTLNPDQYAKLCTEIKLKDAFVHFFVFFLLIFGVMLFLFVPAALIDSGSLTQKFQQFDTFSIGGNYSASSPVELSSRPSIVVDLGENATHDGEQLFFTNEGIYWNSYYYFGENSLSWGEVTDVRALGTDLLFLLLLFLAPSLAVWFGVYFFLKYLLLALLFGLLGFLVPRLWGHQLRIENAMKIALFSASIMMLVQMIPFPFIRIPFLATVLYIVYVGIGIALVGDRAKV